MGRLKNVGSGLLFGMLVQILQHIVLNTPSKQLLHCAGYGGSWDGEDSGRVVSGVWVGDVGRTGSTMNGGRIGGDGTTYKSGGDDDDDLNANILAHSDQAGAEDNENGGGVDSEGGGGDGNDGVDGSGEGGGGGKVRLLCWFMTDPGILNKSLNVKKTWSNKCDVRLFVSSKSDPAFPAVGVDVPEGRNHIGAKSRAAWTLLYEKYRDQADYFMKADPDSYVSISNLRLFLRTRRPQNPEFFGHALFYGHQNWLGNFSGFYSAGQNVVLSRESLIRLASHGIDKQCFSDGQAEDLKTAVCLSRKGAHLSDTRDKLARETFMPATGLASALGNYFPTWYTKFYRKHLGYCNRTQCLSNFPIVFHYVTREMFLIQFLEDSGVLQRKSFIDGAVEKGLLKFNGTALTQLYPNTA